MNAVVYEEPTVSMEERRNALFMAVWIYIVAIVVIVALGAVALFCIYKGKTLAWAQKGWWSWTIACK
jgi:hypothetical protein